MSQQYIVNKWNGGMSNDEYVGQAGSFLNAEGVEIRKNSKAFYLSKNGSSYTWIAPTPYGYAQAFLGTNLANMKVFFRNGQIVQFATQGLLHDQSGELVPSTYINYAEGLNTTIGGVAYNCVVVGKNVLDIGVFKYGDDWVTVDDFAISSGNLATETEYRPLLLYNGELLIGDGNYVSKFDNTRTVTNYLRLDDNDSVRGITVIGDQILIFTKNGSNGYVYYWDGQSLATNRRVLWYSNPILNVANMGNQCYVWNGNGIYLSDGYQRNHLYKNYQNEDNINEHIYLKGQQTNAIETLDKVVYFPGLTDALNSGSKPAIYSYGSYQPGLPLSLVKEFTMGQYTSDEITALYWTDSSHLAGGGTPAQLYYAYYQNNAIRARLGVKDQIGEEGFVELNPIVGDPARGILEATEKETKKIQIGYHIPFLTTGGVEVLPQIEIYAKADDETSYTLIRTITDYQKRKDWITYNKPFYKIQFKIKIKRGYNSVGTYFSPYIFDFTLFYDLLHLEG